MVDRGVAGREQHHPQPGRDGLERRGVRSDEYLDAMTALWTDPAPEFHGTYVDFAAVDAYPRPAGLRVVVGGRSAGGLV